MDEKTESVLKSAKKDKVDFVWLMFCDFLGALKSVKIPAEKLEDSLNDGTWFDGSSIEGFSRICESDMYLKPDPDTYALLPWESEGAARIICDIHEPGGKPFEGDPRHILKRACEEADELGFKYMVGPELEFFLFKKNSEGKTELTPHDNASYFDYAPRDLASELRKEIYFALKKMGLMVETSHHEVSPGQHEISFRYDHALKTADNAITFKHIVKATAHKHNVHATFMPKPIFGINGSGMHIHQSLFDLNGNNAFFDANGTLKLSDAARSFIAGQLKHIKAMCAVLSPTVNSYKRLVKGFEAPVYICWGQRNRSALIRIPRYSSGRENSTRAELRSPDPSGNPYLAFAVMLKAGLDGIKNQLIPPKPTEENVYELDNNGLKKNGLETLPWTLREAIHEFEKSELMKETFGKHAFERYVEAKKLEWKNYNIQVSQWELDTYLETT